jgi:hypothetical protein
LHELDRCAKDKTTCGDDIINSYSGKSYKAVEMQPVDMFPPTDSAKSAFDLFPTTDNVKDINPESIIVNNDPII